MRKIIELLRNFFSPRIDQSVEARNTRGTTINQTVNIQTNFFTGIVLIVLAVFAAYLGFIEYRGSKYNLAPMDSGRFNIIIVPFSNYTEGKCGVDDNIGSRIASTFYTQLTSAKYDENVTANLAFRSPVELPVLQGETETQLTRSVEEVAIQINAQLAIYGYVTCTNITKRPSVKVLFFVSPSGFSDAQELIGEFSFSSGALYGNVGPGEDILASNENLKHKINVIYLIINSLGLYLGDDFKGALDYLSDALDSPLWESEDGKEVVYILTGNAETRYAQQLNLSGQEQQAIKEIDLAQTYYDLANQMSKKRGLGEYTRAQIGLAGVKHFLATYKSLTSCEFDDIDFVSLYEEKSILEKALQADNNPSTADIREKVAFNTAQIDLTLYAVFPDDVLLENVKTNYQIVISSYTNDENTNLRLRELAARSYSGLAFVNWYRGDENGVIYNFNQAIAVTGSPSQQAGYLKSLGNYYSFIQDYKTAIVYYEETAILIREFDIQTMPCDTSIEELISVTKEWINP